jgi:hypothetical protein
MLFTNAGKESGVECVNVVAVSYVDAVDGEYIGTASERDGDIGRRRVRLCVGDYELSWR